MTMKLLMENWRKYISESDQFGGAGASTSWENKPDSGGILLYHGTCFPPESFIGGIDPSRAHGFGQGEGFYFWTNKERAIKHTVDHILKGKNKQEKCPEDTNTGYIVISDEPITSENFDIDYEIYARGFATFILNNLEYFFKNKKELGIIPHRISKRKTFREYFMEHPHQFKVDTISSTIKLAYMAEPGRETSAVEAEALGILASKLAKVDSKMFRDFESEALPNSTAVKYNGEKILYPLRIEDLEGNIVWSRKDQSLQDPRSKEEIEDVFSDLSSQSARALDTKKMHLAKVLKKALKDQSQNVIKKQIQKIGSRIAKKAPVVGWALLSLTLADMASKGDYLGMADEIIAASPVGIPYDISKVFIKALQTPTSRKTALGLKLSIIDKI